MDKEGLVKMSSDVTEQLLSISRHLADTTKRSADTLETLGMTVYPVSSLYIMSFYSTVVKYIVALISFI